MATAEKIIGEGKAEPEPGAGHVELFGHALRNALDLAPGVSGADAPEREVRVVFEARLTNTRPADIGEYRAYLIEKRPAEEA